jgi:hypothetical protein
MRNLSTGRPVVEGSGQAADQLRLRMEKVRIHSPRKM